MHIVDMVYFWARTSPRRPAVIEPAGSMTYAAFAHAVEAAAEHFAQNIADKPRPVAVSIQTGSKMLVALLGLLRASSGRVTLLGGDPWRETSALHRRLAYVPGEVNCGPTSPAAR